MKNIPIISLIPRIWLLVLFTVAANLACLNEWCFQTFGALIYIPAVASLSVLVGLIVIHLFFRQTVDQDAHDGTYLADWRALTAEQRVRYATIIRIGLLIALAIIAAGVGK